MNSRQKTVKRSVFKYSWGLVPLFVIIVLWLTPILEIEKRAPKLEIKEKIELENKLRTTLAQVLGGLFLLSGVYFSWKTLKQNQENQITDRFYKAVEQLGNNDPKNQAVIIGGIYALERIAIDSPKDHWTIMEVLCSYVRMNSPITDNFEKVNGFAMLDSMSKGGLINKIKPDPVIQTILTVLGRRNIQNEKVIGRLDLRNSYLRGAVLLGTDFSNALFDNSHLEWAYFHGANLKGASFDDAHLEAAFLSDSNMENVSLVDSYLEGADLRNTNLTNSNLIYSHLQGATPENCNVRDAKFGGANLTNVDLKGFVNVTEEQIGEAVIQIDPNENMLTYIKELDLEL